MLSPMYFALGMQKYNQIRNNKEKRETRWLRTSDSLGRWAAGGGRIVQIQRGTTLPDLPVMKTKSCWSYVRFRDKVKDKKSLMDVNIPVSR